MVDFHYQLQKSRAKQKGLDFESALDRVDKLERQNAAMRAVLGKFRHERDCSCTDCIMVDELLRDADAGVGWVSPEELRRLLDEATKPIHVQLEQAQAELRTLSHAAAVNAGNAKWWKGQYEAAQAEAAAAVAVIRDERKGDCWCYQIESHSPLCQRKQAVVDGTAAKALLERLEELEDDKVNYMAVVADIDHENRGLRAVRDAARCFMAFVGWDDDIPLIKMSVNTNKALRKLRTALDAYGEVKRSDDEREAESQRRRDECIGRYGKPSDAVKEK